MKAGWRSRLLQLLVPVPVKATPFFKPGFPVQEPNLISWMAEGEESWMTDSRDLDQKGFSDTNSGFSDLKPDFISLPTKEEKPWIPDQEALDGKEVPSDHSLGVTAIWPGDFYISRNRREIWLKEPPGQRTTAARAMMVSAPGVTTHAIEQVTECLSSCLFLFFSPSMLDLVLECSNKYGVECCGDAWEPISENELCAYLGLRILAGVYRSCGESLEELWSSEDGRPVFRGTMSLGTFKKISRVLRFADQAQCQRTSWGNKLAPVADLWNMFVETLPKCFVPHENVTIGEQLVTFRGSCPFRRYMPPKAAKYGIKFWLCYDSVTSYVLNADISTKRECSALAPANLEDIVMKLAKTVEGSGRNVTTGNSFTSVELARELLTKQLTLVGAVKKNRPEVPQEFLGNRSRRAHSSIFGFQGDLTLVSYVPKRGKAVILLSSLHMGSGRSATEGKPEVLHFYNKKISCVETCNRLISLYTTKRVGRHWPLVVFSNILDIACLNAYIIWISCHPDWNATSHRRRRLFLLQVGKEMVTPLLQSRNIGSLPEPAREAACRVSGRGPGSRKRGRCYVCPRKKDRKVQQKCPKCGLFVCSEHMLFTCCECTNK
ncbi:uncharacterized protein LOC128343447 isoform X3 [Hemicordylus capensis]|uniref:uncharacterized protein LOC128343447 isoform X3 n=2 Tax=Hemicordylus capensis TaxID=884348 RepID=UPI002303571E|nr:uncharacterized protein LOC128343447 isoform X3 [Hemicordylus capensis]